MGTSTKTLLLCLIPWFVYQLQLHQFSPVSAATTMAGKIEIFTVYQHDRLNETGYVVVTGDEGAPSSDTTRPFGSIYVFRDDLTLHNDSDSPVAGVMEGTATTTSFDGLHNLLAAKISLHHRCYRGSVSVLGGLPQHQAVGVPGGGRHRRFSVHGGIRSVVAGGLGWPKGHVQVGDSPVLATVHQICSSSLIGLRHVQPYHLCCSQSLVLLYFWSTVKL
jgi:hypothetical protein